MNEKEKAKENKNPNGLFKWQIKDGKKSRRERRKLKQIEKL